MKVTVSPSSRTAVRAVYQGVLGATRDEPKPELDVFVFQDRQIGFYYSEREHLTEAQHLLGVWLEFDVHDVAEVQRGLLEAGAVRLPYDDHAQPYFQGPGGLVFRLAQA